MDLDTLEKEKKLILDLEKELRGLQKQNRLLFNSMHKYAKPDFEERADTLAKKINSVSQTLQNACNNLLLKLKDFPPFVLE